MAVVVGFLVGLGFDEFGPWWWEVRFGKRIERKCWFLMSEGCLVVVQVKVVWCW